MKRLLFATSLLTSPAWATGAPGSDQFSPLPDTTNLATLTAAANANAQASSEYGGNPISLQPGDCIIGQNCSLTDAKGNVWTLVPNDLGNVGMGQVMENGQPSNYHGDGSWIVALRLLANGQVAWESAKGIGWYSDTFWSVADPGPSAAGGSTNVATGSASAADTTTPAAASTAGAPSQNQAISFGPGLTLAPASTTMPSSSPSGTTVPAAAGYCAGETFFDNFQSGLNQWQLGNNGAPDPAGTNSSEADPSAVISTGTGGLNMSVAPGGPSGTLGSWLASDHSQLYGYFQAAMDIPATAGTTAAFWLTGVTAWPPEIDIAETNGATNSSSTHTTGTSDTGALYSSLQPGVHTYGVNWTPDNVDFYVDGQLTHSTPAPQPPVPMQLMLDYMAGGPQSYIGAPNLNGQPTTARVLYVSAFDSMQSAQACTLPKVHLDPERCLLAPRGPGCPPDVPNTYRPIQLPSIGSTTPAPSNTPPSSAPTSSPSMSNVSSVSNVPSMSNIPPVSPPLTTNSVDTTQIEQQLQQIQQELTQTDAGQAQIEQQLQQIQNTLRSMPAVPVTTVAPVIPIAPVATVTTSSTGSDAGASDGNGGTSADASNSSEASGGDTGGSDNGGSDTGSGE